MRGSLPKLQRIDVRADKESKERWKAAAVSIHRSLSDFVTIAVHRLCLHLESLTREQREEIALLVNEVPPPPKRGRPRLDRHETSQTNGQARAK